MAQDEKPVSVLNEHAETPLDDLERRPSRSLSQSARRKIERRLVWKQDLTILPLLAICFFFSYVVRMHLDLLVMFSLTNSCRIAVKSEMHD